MQADSDSAQQQTGGFFLSVGIYVSGLISVYFAADESPSSTVFCLAALTMSIFMGLFNE